MPLYTLRCGMRPTPQFQAAACHGVVALLGAAAYMGLLLGKSRRVPAHPATPITPRKTADRLL